MRILIIAVLSFSLLCCSVQYYDILPQHKTSSNKTLVLKAPDIFDNAHKKDWKLLEEQIITTKSNNIIINWMGYGGSTTMGDDFIDVVRYAQKHHKKVSLHVEGFTASMHANVVCQVNNYTMTDKAVLAFHGVYWRALGKKVYVDDETRRYGSFCVVAGILTNKDLNLIVNHRKMVLVYANGTKMVIEDQGLIYADDTKMIMIEDQK